eukprot:scaffold147346_cov53-Cyclotella_meneghiniana.AAC.4
MSAAKSGNDGCRHGGTCNSDGAGNTASVDLAISCISRKSKTVEDVKALFSAVRGEGSRDSGFY